MFWRSGKSDDPFTPFQSLAAITLFAWLLGVLGLYDIGRVVYLLLAMTVALVLTAALQAEGGRGGVHVALIALFAWLLGVMGVYDIGESYHLLLAIVAVIIVARLFPVRRTRA